MHIFFFDLKNQLDMISPLVWKLGKENKVKVFNINLFLNINSQNNRLISSLSKNRNIEFVNNFKFQNFYFVLLNLFLKRLMLVVHPYRKISKFFYTSSFYLSKKFICKNLNYKLIKTVTFEESLPNNKQLFLNSLFCNSGIKVIKIHGGLNILKVKTSKTIFDNCDYYLSPNYFWKSKSIIENKKFIKLGSPRYDKIWIKNLQKIYSTKKKLYNSRKNKVIGLIVNPANKIYSKMLKLGLELKKKNYKVLISEKNKNTQVLEYKNIFQATEIIMNSDIIISYPSSIICEALVENKIVIFPNYVIKDSKIYKKNMLNNYKAIYKLNSLDEIYGFIKSLTRRKYHLKYKTLLKDTIGISKKSILKKYTDFYSKI